MITTTVVVRNDWAEDYPDGCGKFCCGQYLLHLCAHLQVGLLMNDSMSKIVCSNEAKIELFAASSVFSATLSSQFSTEKFHFFHVLS
jgi:hypothetical protein